MRISLLSALLLAGTGMATAHAQTIGVNSAVKNDVSIQSDSDDAPRVASVGGDVALRDTIRSGDDAALQVLLLDETVFTVGPQAELVVDRFVYDPDAGSGEVAAAVARGAFRFMSGRTARQPDAVNIETPVASMGVRGTIVEGVIGAADIARVLAGSPILSGLTLTEQSSLVILRGPGTDQNGTNRDGAVEVTNNSGTVTLNRANTAVLVVGSSSVIIGPFALPDLSNTVLRDFLGTRPNGASQADLPRITLPSGRELEFDEFIAGRNDIEDEFILDRPTGDCPVGDGLPATDGGLILDGNGGRDVIGDFGSIVCN